MITEDDFTAIKQLVPAKPENIQSTQVKVMNGGNAIQLRPLNRSYRDILLRMYRGFGPLGLELGLPPRNEEGRQIWIDSVIQQEINIGAFSPSGDLLGHGFLATSGMGEAEVAFFVQQGYRRRGIGTALVKAVLQWAEQRGLRRVWSMNAAENDSAMRVLKRCGFRFSQYVLPGIEFDIELPAPFPAEQDWR